MKKSGWVKISAVLLLCLSTVASSWAGFWDWTQPYKGPKRDIVNLIITANYRDTLLLAQVVQYHTKQPFILLPAKGQDQIFFWPARQDTALEIPEKDLSRFISYLNPQRIIVIGAVNVVNEKYLSMIPRDQTVMVIYNQDWQRVAESLDGILRAPNISTDFSRLHEQLINGALYAPTQDKTTQDKSLEKKIAASQSVPRTELVAGGAAAPLKSGETIKIVTVDPSGKITARDNMPQDAPVLIDANK